MSALPAASDVVAIRKAMTRPDPDSTGAAATYVEMQIAVELADEPIYLAEYDDGTAEIALPSYYDTITTAQARELSAALDWAIRAAETLGTNR